MINLLLVDHNRLFAEGLQAAIESRKDGFSVCGIAWDVREAVRKLKENRPSIIVLSLRDSRQSTLSAMRSLSLQCSRIPVVLLSAVENSSLVVEALRCGARGFLRMNLSVSQLLMSLRAVVAGSLVLDPRAVPEILNCTELIGHGGARPDEQAVRAVAGLPEAQPVVPVRGAQALADGARGSATAPIPHRGEDSPAFVVSRGVDIPEWYDNLTRKERQILWFVVQDFQNEDIGEHLHLASQTVRNYISRIYCKLGVENRAQAIRLARDSLLF